MENQLAQNQSMFSQAVTDFSFLPGHGDPIHQAKPDPNLPLPSEVYFIYIGFDKSNNLVVRQLFRPLNGGNLRLTEEDMLADAQQGKNVKDSNFENMTWQRPCFITMVIDQVDWRFYWRNSPDPHDAIVFRASKDVGDYGSKNYDPNLTFYDGVHDSVRGPDGEMRDAVRFVNYFLGDDGKPLHGDPRNYCFEIYLEAPFGMKGPKSHITMLIDPDGQNQGPQPLENADDKSENSSVGKVMGEKAAKGAPPTAEVR